MSEINKVEVVVLGAGAAGLAAASALHAAGIEVVVIEARERIGGRVFTHREPGTPVPIELGAEFIHGVAPEVEQLIEEAALASVEIEGHRWTLAEGRIGRADDFWDRLDRVMRRLDSVRGPDRSFRSFLETHVRGRSFARDRRLALQFVEGFHAADPSLISMRALAEGGSPRGDVRERRLGRVVDGYDRVIDRLALPLAGRIRTSTIATRVGWEPNHAHVEVRGKDGRSRTPLEARAAIVAVPLGVLKAAPGEIGAIEFSPALRQKALALDGLAVGSVVRVVLRFSERFWASGSVARRLKSDELDTISFMHTPDEDFPVWWTAYPVRVPTMVGWCGGPRARLLAKCGTEEIHERAVTSLARQFGIPRRRLREMVTGAWSHDWEHDPFARGAYSYQVVGGLEAPAALARPLRGTLFFAGEAADPEGRTGTVHGAIATGRRAAAQVRRSLAAGGRRVSR